MQEDGKQFPVRIDCPPERTKNETADGKSKRKPEEQNNRRAGQQINRRAGQQINRRADQQNNRKRGRSIW